jgi:hypothetical protein
VTIPEPYKHIIDGARAFQAEARDILKQADTRPLLIGVGGKLTAGKDTFADFLVARHGFQKLGMSDPLATALYTLNPLVSLAWEGFTDWSAENDWDTHTEITRYQDIIDHTGYLQAKRIPEVRRLLQVLGTEVGRRMLGEDTWANIAKRTIEDIRSAGVPVVITGVRYGNERELIEDLGGMLVWVERPQPAEQAQSAATAPNIGSVVIQAIDNALDPQSAAQHSSEISLTAEDFHLVLVNDGSLEDLARRTDAIIETVHSEA